MLRDKQRRHGQARGARLLLLPRQGRLPHGCRQAGRQAGRGRDRQAAGKKASGYLGRLMITCCDTAAALQQPRDLAAQQSPTARGYL